MTLELTEQEARIVTKCLESARGEITQKLKDEKVPLYSFALDYSYDAITDVLDKIEQKENEEK